MDLIFFINDALEIPRVSCIHFKATQANYMVPECQIPINIMYRWIPRGLCMVSRELNGYPRLPSNLYIMFSNVYYVMLRHIRMIIVTVMQCLF